MFILISPSKTQNFDSSQKSDHTQPFFKQEIRTLIYKLKEFNEEKLQELMNISPKLAALNCERFYNFSMEKFDLENGKQALFAFKGDVYDGINIEKYDKKDLDFAQQHLGILSGLYGLLRPLDIIQPYRLEMSTNLVIGNKKNLYEFWGNKISDKLNDLVLNNDFIINLASNEYYNAVKPENLNAKTINVIFKEKKDSEYKIVGILAKKARGIMTNYIIKNRITSPEQLKYFNLNHYSLSKEMSDQNSFVFIR